MPYVFIAIAGFIGAVLRYALGLTFAGLSFPAGTLIINLLGCFLLEITYNFVGRRLHVRQDVVRAMGVGLLGAFSTLSAFSNETVGMLVGGQYAMAALYGGCTLFGCFLASLAGRAAADGMALLRLRQMQRQQRHAIKRFR